MQCPFFLSKLERQKHCFNFSIVCVFGIIYFTGETKDLAVCRLFYWPHYVVIDSWVVELKVMVISRAAFN